jgi:hypothetical protein
MACRSQPPAAACKILGRLWYCRDIVQSDIRLAVEDLVGEDRHLWTNAMLVRALRPFVAEQITSSDQ